jgi:hypothetical protein
MLVDPISLFASQYPSLVSKTISITIDALRRGFALAWQRRNTVHERGQ